MQSRRNYDPLLSPSYTVVGPRPILKSSLRNRLPLFTRHREVIDGHLDGQSVGLLINLIHADFASHIPPHVRNKWEVMALQRAPEKRSHRYGEHAGRFAIAQKGWRTRRPPDPTQPG